MIVVSDTGPLNYLALIGHLEALPKLYEVVVIPKAVASELSSPSCPETVRALIESPPVWLRIDQAPESDPDLSALGEGEQQAIALARTLHADLLLCDDRDARDDLGLPAGSRNPDAARLHGCGGWGLAHRD